MKTDRDIVFNAPGLWSIVMPTEVWYLPGTGASVGPFTFVNVAGNEDSYVFNNKADAHSACLAQGCTGLAVPQTCSRRTSQVIRRGPSCARGVMSTIAMRRSITWRSLFPIARVSARDSHRRPLIHISAWRACTCVLCVRLPGRARIHRWVRDPRSAPAG